MHYGDSQLEGDRIRSYLRNKLQAQFGGSGPGLVAVADIVPSFSIDRVISDDWIRYSVMGRRDPTQQHDRYGALSSFSRFTPILPDTVPPDSAVHEASVTLKPLRRAYGKAQQYNEEKLYYGWHRAPLTLEVHNAGELVSSEVVEPADHLLIHEWKFADTPQELTFTFKGADSPDVYGISLESRTGICMDNIAARGAAGYEFRKTDQALLGRMFNDLDVELLILQYGGNSSLRYGKTTQAVCNGAIGRVLHAETFSPADLEPHHVDLYWYGVHGCEALFTVMGTGCKSVKRGVTSDGKIEVTGTWEGGRTGVFREANGTDRKGYGGKAVGEKGESPIGSYDGYNPLLFAIVQMFHDGKVPVSADETLELYALWRRLMRASDAAGRK